MPSAYVFSIGEVASRRGEVGEVGNSGKAGKCSVACRSAFVAVWSVPQKVDWWSTSPASATRWSCAGVTLSAGAFWGVTGAAPGVESDELVPDPRKKTGLGLGMKELPMEANLLRLDVALSAAENIMVASSALISARPGGRE